VLVVDYPPEEAADFAALLEARDLAPIFLLAPTTPEVRIAAVAKIARGYVYYVSLKGVTGAGHLDTVEVGRRLGLRPEVARTCQEVGLRLGDGRYELEGRGSAAFLDEARRTFSELGLEWDLARLERRASP
jgi:tryptophan synthase alpha chain